MTAKERREKVCAQARAWLGKNEADGSFREIIDLYNRNRPAQSYRMTYADPWCAAFVSAVGMAAGLGDVLYPHVNCEGMIAAYRTAGRWVEADDYPARPGDLIFYDWEDSGVGDNHGSADHVGIIVTSNDYYFTVIEGNKSDAVGTRTLAHNSRFIRGFAVPDYEASGEDEATGEDGRAAEEDSPGGGNVGAADKGGADVGPYGETEANSAFRIPNSALDSALVALPVLRYGDVSEAVRAAQLLLYGRGVSCGPDGADGELGPNTLGAVRSFQRSRGLAADGAVGRDTWSALLGVTA